MSKIIPRLLELGVDLSTRKALKRALRMLGLKPENLDNLYIELKNSVNEDAFRRVGPEKKIVFLPQCLRDCNRCRARLERLGYKCVSCSRKCKARRIREAAESLGYRVFIVPGGSMVSRVIKDIRPQAVLGVACKKELVMAFDEISLPVQGVQLLRDGCVNTDVDAEEVLRVLKRR